MLQEFVIIKGILLCHLKLIIFHLKSHWKSNASIIFDIKQELHLLVVIFKVPKIFFLFCIRGRVGLFERSLMAAETPPLPPLVIVLKFGGLGPFPY